MARLDNKRWGEAEDEAFLRALAELKHVGRSAAAIGWTAPTAYERRRRCPAFRERWAALAARPPLELGPTVVRPHRVGIGGKPARPMRLRACKPWTPQIESDFLDMLASTCNVRLSAQSVGFHTHGIYRRRREHPDFERRWDAALAQGYARLEIELVRAAAESVEGVEFQERMIGPVSAADAIRLLQLHRAQVTGQGRRPGTQAALPSIDEVRENIRRRAAAIRAARTLPASTRPEAG